MQPLGALESRPEAQRFACIICGFVKSARRIVRNCDAAEKACHLRIQGTEPDRFLAMLDRLAVQSGKTPARDRDRNAPQLNSD